MEAWNEYGFTSYDFSNSGMPPQVIKYCLIEVLKSQTPELFIIDLRSFQTANVKHGNTIWMYDEAYIRNFTDTFKYSLNRAGMINAALPKQESRWAYYFDIAKYHSNVEAALSGNRINYTNDVNKGYVLVERTAPIDFPQYAKQATKSLEDKVQAVFDDLVEFCSNKDLNILFVVPPYQLEAEHIQIYNYLKEQLSFWGYPVWNGNEFYTQMGLDPKMDFFDHAHANIYGAEKYTAFLGCYLTSNYSLEDRRTQLEYSLWNDNYSLWAVSRDKAKETIRLLVETG